MECPHCKKTIDEQPKTITFYDSHGQTMFETTVTYWSKGNKFQTSFEPFQLTGCIGFRIEDKW